MLTPDYYLVKVCLDYLSSLKTNIWVDGEEYFQLRIISNTEFMHGVDLGSPSHDGALSGCEMSRYQHSPGWNQEGPAGACQTWSSGEVLPRPAPSGGADQSDVRWPLHSRHGEEISAVANPDCSGSLVFQYSALICIDKFIYLKKNYQKIKMRIIRTLFLGSRVQRVTGQ